MAEFEWNVKDVNGNTVGGAWTSPGNWLMDGQTATRIPTTGDAVTIPGQAATTFELLAYSNITAPSKISYDDSLADANGYYTNMLRIAGGGGARRTMTVAAGEDFEINTPYLDLNSANYFAGDIIIGYGADGLVFAGSGSLTKTGPGSFRFSTYDGAQFSNSFVGEFNLKDGWYSVGDSSGAGGSGNFPCFGAGTVINVGDINTAYSQNQLGFWNDQRPATAIYNYILAYKLNINADFSIGGNYLADKGGTYFSAGATLNKDITITVNKASYIAGNIDGSYGFTKDGVDLLWLNGNNTFSGIVRSKNGTLGIYGQNAFKYATINHLNVDAGVYSTNLAVGTVLRGGDLIGDRDFSTTYPFEWGYANGNGTYSGLYGGTGAITKVGTGNWSLTGNGSTRTGATTVSDGFLTIYDSTTLGSTATGGITVNNSGSLILTGSATNLPAKALSLGGSGRNDPSGYTSQLQIKPTNNAAVTILSAITLTTDVNIYSDASSVTMSGSGNITSAGYSLSLTSGVYEISKIVALGAGSLTTHNSTITLNSANTFTGYFYNDSGSVYIGNSNALQNATLWQANGSIDFINNVTTASIGSMHGSSPTINLTNDQGLPVSLSIKNMDAFVSSYYWGVMSGLGSLTVSNASNPHILTLENDQQYTGATVVNNNCGINLNSQNGIAASSGLTLGTNCSLYLNYSGNKYICSISANAGATITI
jgi:autotransporter-associated beta strand protein